MSPLKKLVVSRNRIGVDRLVRGGVRDREGGAVSRHAQALPRRGREGRGALRRLPGLRKSQDSQRAHAAVEDRRHPGQASTPGGRSDLLPRRRPGRNRHRNGRADRCLRRRRKSRCRPRRRTRDWRAGIVSIAVRPDRTTTSKVISMALSTRQPRGPAATSSRATST